VGLRDDRVLRVEEDAALVVHDHRAPRAVSGGHLRDGVDEGEVLAVLHPDGLPRHPRPGADLAGFGADHRLLGLDAVVQDVERINSTAVSGLTMYRAAP
jgi:hypothetical protein